MSHLVEYDDEIFWRDYFYKYIYFDFRGNPKVFTLNEAK